MKRKKFYKKFDDETNGKDIENDPQICAVPDHLTLKVIH